MLQPVSASLYFLRLNNIHGVYISYLLYPFICPWALRYFLYHAIVNDAAVNVDTISYRVSVCSFFGEKLLDCLVVLF